jgi:hypothetical protein
VRDRAVYSWPAEGELIFSFLCRIVGGVLAGSDETPQVAHCAHDRLPPNLFTEHAERVADALAGVMQPALRVPGAPSATDEIRAGRSA